METSGLENLANGYGEKSANAKLTCKKVSLIKAMLWKNNKPKVIAKMFGVSPDVIRSIKNHHSWQYVKIRNPQTLEWFW